MACSRIVPVRVVALVGVLAVAAFVICGCAAGSKQLVGAWQLVEPRMDAPDADSSSGEPAGEVADAYVLVKILTDSYFSFGCLSPLELVYGGGGRYTYDGRGHYSEYIRYHSFPYLIGTRVDFTCRLVGDLWYHDGAYTLHGETHEIHEVWRRRGGRTSRTRSVPD